MAVSTALSLVFGLTAAVPVLAQPSAAADLLGRAQAAFEHNRKLEPQWNWAVRQTHRLTDRSGREIKHLPDVTVESVIRKDGRRCNAVLSWGDGVAPYKLNEDPDARCGGQDPTEPPLRIEALLKSPKATAHDANTVAIHHDKGRTHDPQPEVRCTASIEGLVRLDPVTFFPTHVEGKVVDSGCEGETWAELHYGDAPVKMASRRGLMKGTSFRMEFGLQPDRYGNAANSFWVATEQHWERPLRTVSNIVYSNRRFDINMRDVVWLTDVHVTAQEFGAQSSTRFDSIREEDRE